MTAQLLWHVQNCELIWSLLFMQKQCAGLNDKLLNLCETSPGCPGIPHATWRKLNEIISSGNREQNLAVDNKNSKPLLFLILLFHPFPQSFTIQYIFFYFPSIENWTFFRTDYTEFRRKLCQNSLAQLTVLLALGPLGNGIYKALFHFSINIYNIHPIAHPWVWGIGCLLGVECFIFIYVCKWHHVCNIISYLTMGFKKYDCLNDGNWDLDELQSRILSYE